jgi:myosin heavy subunit
MKVLERMLNMLSEDEQQLNNQRKKLEDYCNTLMRNVKSHADTEEDKIKKTKADLQSKMDKLAEILSQSDLSATSATLKSTLLPDADAAKMQEKTEQEKQTDFFKPLHHSLKLQTAAVNDSSTHPSGEGLDDVLLFGDGRGDAAPRQSSLVSEALRV